MSHALNLASRDVLAEVYELLVTLDPARWRDDLDDAAREKLTLITEHLQELNQRFERRNEDASLDHLRERFEVLSRVCEEFREKATDSRERLRTEWAQLRTRLHPEYAMIASSLREDAIAVPCVRPTNITRSVMHVLFAVTILLSIQFWMTPNIMIGVSSLFAVWAWNMEFFRRRSERLNLALMKLFDPVAHPHEVYGINSGTWYSTAMLLVATTSTPLVSSVAVMILGLADPAAGTVGRRFGKRKLVGSRTLVGTTTFVIVGVLTAWLVITLFGPAYTPFQLFVMVTVAAISGAIGELFGGRLDDNLTIPVTSAWGLSLAMMFLGV
jgi:dolichol kinase